VGESFANYVRSMRGGQLPRTRFVQPAIPSGLAGSPWRQPDTSPPPDMSGYLSAFVRHDLKCSQVVTPIYGASLRQCSRIDFQGCLGNAFVRQGSHGTAKLAPVNSKLLVRSTGRSHKPVLSFLLDQA
jgi:hypothetical protein